MDRQTARFSLDQAYAVAAVSWQTGKHHIPLFLLIFFAPVIPFFACRPSLLSLSLPITPIPSASF